MQLDQEKVRTLGQRQMIMILKKELPSFISLFAYNISKTDMSVYTLLYQTGNQGQNYWMTLRLADHSLWLKHAQQVSLDLGSPADLIRLSEKIQKQILSEENVKNWYQLTKKDIAILYLLDKCQKNGLVWAVRLPEEIFAAFKKRPLDLQVDFMKAELFLTNRNNVNSFLLSVQNHDFHKQLAKLYGENLLFSQFSRHHLLKLLPTNQWVQPMLKKEPTIINWKQFIIYYYGQDFYQKVQNLLSI